MSKTTAMRAAVTAGVCLFLVPAATNAQATRTQPGGAAGDSCVATASVLQRDLDAVRLAIEQEADPFQTPRADLVRIMGEAQAGIGRLREAGAVTPGPEEQKVLETVRSLLARLPGKPLWQFVDAEGWRPIVPEGMWAAPAPDDSGPGSGKGLVVNIRREMKLGGKSRRKAFPVLLKTIPSGQFAGYNRLVVWVRLTGCSHQFLDIVAYAKGLSSYSDTDRNHWLREDHWVRVVWDFHYRDEEYRTKIDTLYLRGQNRGAVPGESDLQQYFIRNPVLLRVKPRKCRGWDPDPTLVVADQVGYKPVGRKIGLVNEAAPGETFVLREAATGKAVHEGALKATTTPIGPFKLADFSDFERDGRFELCVGPLRSHPFEIREDALRPALESAMYFLRCDRSACDTPYQRATSLDDARRLDNGERQDFTGGWYDAGDTYQVPGNTMLACHHLSRLREVSGPLQFSGSGPVRRMSDVLLAMKRIETPLRPPYEVVLWRDPDHLLDETRWGLEFLLKHQDSSGGVYYGQHPHGVTPEQKERMYWAFYVQGYYSDNVIGTDDDKWWNTTMPPQESGTMFVFVDLMSRAAIAFREKDPEFAARCLAAAKQGWQYNRAEDKSEWANGAVPASAAVLAAVELFRASGGAQIKAEAVARGDRLADLVQLDFSFAQAEKVTGFFWNGATRASPFINVQWLAFPYVALAELCRAFPDEPEWIRWYAALRISGRFYWEKMCAFHAPYNCAPPGLFPEMDVKAELGDGGEGRMLARYPREKFVPVGKLFLRHFAGARARGANTWPRASNACFIQSAVALIRMAMATDDPGLEALARDQLHWVLGVNPFAVSTITGVGAEPILGMSGQAYIPGKVCYGGVGWDLANDCPFHSRNARGYHALQWKEASIVNSAPFIQAAGLLCAPAHVSGRVTENGKPLAGKTVRLQRKERSVEAVSDADGNFGPVAVNAGGEWRVGVDGVSVPIMAVSGRRYRTSLDVAREASFVLAVPAVLKAGVPASVTVRAAALGKAESEHSLELRAFNLSVDGAVRTVRTAPGKAATVEWEVKPEQPGVPFLIVLTPDGQSSKRLERMGEVAPKG